MMKSLISTIEKSWFIQQLFIAVSGKGEYKKAYELLNKAYGIIVLYKDTQIEQATTLTNMAATLAKLGRLDEAMVYEKKAIDIFVADGEKTIITVVH